MKKIVVALGAMVLASCGQAAYAAPVDKELCPSIRLLAYNAMSARQNGVTIEQMLDMDASSIDDIANPIIIGTADVPQAYSRVGRAMAARDYAERVYAMCITGRMER